MTKARDLAELLDHAQSLSAELDGMIPDSYRQRQEQEHQLEKRYRDLKQRYEEGDVDVEGFDDLARRWDPRARES
jgi:hypothetical protein